MENKQFTSDNLKDHSPHSSQGFQADRFIKKTTFLSIPDTIPENSSAELSGDSLKMEAAKTITDALSDNDKENISSNQTVQCNESLNTSIILAIDNSYIKQCERKLLENSNSEDDKNIKNKSLIDKHLLEVPRMSSHLNDTISTPPSALRKEISLLRNEMAEAHEFHDLEIQLLKEEKLQNEADSYNYSELISKYSSLMELYTNLKTEYHNYRVEQQQMRQEMQSKTADCLESLCSQIEASDNSLNVSSASFVSFNGGIKSSTMLEDVTEVEATILHDATILADDPLSITNDCAFKTPMQTPLKSAKKLFSQESNGKPTVREVKEIIAKRDPFDSEYNIQILNLETALYDKKKEMEDLEQRLFKIEDFSSVLQNELERITIENKTLKDSLSKKTDQLSELTQKLFTETISLNPSLRNSLVDIPETKLLFIFIETIMESCRKIQEEETAKHNNKKLEWEVKSKADATTIESLKTQISSHLIEFDDLKKKLTDAENTILTRDEEILMLQSHVSNFRQTREDFESAREALLELESKLTLTEAEKTATENRCRELEAVVDGLKREIETNKNIFEEQNSKMKNELESQEVFKFELMTVKEKLTSAEEAVEKLKSQIESLNSEKCELENILLENNNLKQQIFDSNKTSAELENRCIELLSIQTGLNSQIESLESEKLKLQNLCTELDKNKIENDNLKQQILETEKTSAELKSQLESLECNKSQLENRCINFENIRIENENLKQQILESEEVIKSLKTELESFEFRKMELEKRCTELENIRLENENLKQQIFEINKASEALKSQLKTVESEKLILENRCTDFENIQIENKNHKQQITESEEIVKRLKAELESLESVKLDLENRCAEFENIQIENKNHKQQILESEEMINRLKAELKSLEAKNLDLENRCTDFENIRLENENLKQEIFEIGNTSDTLKSQLETLESEKLDLENRCIDFENIRLVNEKTLTQLENRCVELQKILTENDHLKQRISESEKLELEKLKNVRMENENLKGQVLESEEVIKSLKTEIQSLECKKLELENRCEEFENIQIENKNHKQQIIESEEMIKRLKAELESLESVKLELEKLKNVRMENENLNGQVLESEEVIKRLKTELESLESEKLDLENRCIHFENIRLENENLKQKIFEIGKTSDTLKSQLETLESEKLDLENRCVELQKILTENDHLKQRISESEKLELEKLKNVRMENENLKGQLLGSEEVIKRLKTEIESLECKKLELENRRAEFENIQIENKNHKQQILESEEMINRLKAELKSLEAKNLDLENRCTDFENIRLENENLNQEIFEIGKTSEILKSQLESLESEKIVLENRCEDLEKFQIEYEKTSVELKNRCVELQKILTENDSLKQRISESEKLELEKFENVRLENENLKRQVLESEEVIKRLKTELESLEYKKLDLENRCTAFENIRLENENLKQEIFEIGNKTDTLKSQLESLQSEKIVLENRCEDLEKFQIEYEKTSVELKNCYVELQKILMENDNLKQRISESEKLELEKFENVRIENENLKQGIFETEKVIMELKTNLELKKEDGVKNIKKMEELLREIEQLKRHNVEVAEAVEEVQKNLTDLLSGCQFEESPSERITKFVDNSKFLETKIISVFVQTVRKTCQGVENELLRNFDSQKIEWETQKKVLITESKNEKDLLKAKEIQLADREKEIIILKEQHELMKSELEVTQNQQRELVENHVFRLKERLTIAEGELNVKEAKLEELLKDTDSLRKEIEFISQKLEKVEKSNRNLMEVLSDVQTHLNIPLDNLLDCENKKIFSEKINSFVKTQLEGLETENKSLKIGNENLKGEIKQLTKFIRETELKNANASHPNGKSKAGKNMDLCVRRLDKLEEINHNLTELLTRVLTMIEFADLEKLKLCSVREFPNVMRKVVAHVNGLLGRIKEMKEENSQLDEECETYSNIIKNLEKDATAVWKDNTEKTEAFEKEIGRLKEEKNSLEKEKEELAGIISKLNGENLKLKSKTEGTVHTCTCGNESKKINELKRAILVKEQKLLELQDLEAQTISQKSQIEYLKTALERERKKFGEEKEKNKKLQNELKEAANHEKTESKKGEENQVLDELRMRGSISGGIVQEFVDKEKMRKLSKDIGILKELCRARYAEIKRLEAVNAALRNGTPKNINQMDSPIHSRGYNTRSKNQVRDFWKTEISGKENSAV